MQHCVHADAEGCSSIRCLGTTFSAALRGGQGPFSAVSEFSPLVLTFPPVPSREGKVLHVPGKSSTEPRKSLVAGAGPLPGWAGAGREGRAGMAGRAGMGQGQGRAGQGRGTCVILHNDVRRNWLECSFGAFCLGGNPVFFTRFFLGFT